MRKRDGERRNPNTVYMSERKRAAGEPTREKERRRGDQRRDVPAKSDGIRRGRKEEEEEEKRWLLKRGRASGTPANGWNVR